MAEELDIRSIWNRGKAQEDPASLHINMMEKKGTKTTLYWIKIILWIEFWISIAGIPFMIYYLMNSSFGSIYVIPYVLITLIYLVYYQFLIRKINNFSYDGFVVKSLKKVYGYLRFYLLHYKVVIWASLSFGYIIGLMHPQDPEAFEKIQTTKDWVIAITIGALLLIIIGLIMHLIVHLIYGRKIKRLKRMVKEFEKEE